MADKKEKMFHISAVTKDGTVQDAKIDIDYFKDGENFSAQGSYGGYLGRRFDNFEGNISVKSDYNRSDYEWFRAKTLHANAIEQMSIAQKAYEKVGMVRNIMDMMAEFCAQGVRIEHVNPKKERFLQEWFEYVGGPIITERMAHMLYRLGAAPIQAAYGTISLPTENKMSAQAQLGDVEYEPLKIEKKSIPLKYTFIPPWNIEIIGGDLSLFIGKPFYAVKIPSTLSSSLKNANKIQDDKLKQELKDTMSKIRMYSNKAGSYIYLDPDKFDIYFYKKDDWQAWATPIISCIIDDLMLLEKMKLADASALDGAISNIRHWTVGIIDPSNPSNSIIPTKTGINKIRQILSMSVGGGTMDLVTGPEVAFKESSTQVHKFLGTEKYESTLNAIYDGLGIPPPLRGSGGSANATNNYVSLKTLVERLQYGRSILIAFWNKQLSIIQKALGHKVAGKIVFDNMILSDESAEKKLLIELIDRDLVSPDAVQRFFGFNPLLENAKINRTHKKKASGVSPPKASPFHNPQQDFEHKKSLIQNGDITPSEVGIELKPRKPGEKPRVDKLAEQKAANTALKQKGKKKAKKTTNGRPKSVTETSKRKKKPNFRPQTGKGYHNLVLWANEAFNIVTENLSPVILETFGKKNFRQLTVAEFKEAEDFKFSTFAQLQPLSQVTNTSIYAALQCNRRNIADVLDYYEVLKNDFISSNNREMTTEEMRQLFILAYVEAKFKDFSENGV